LAKNDQDQAKVSPMVSLAKINDLDSMKPKSRPFDPRWQDATKLILLLGCDVLSCLTGTGK